MNKGRIKWFDPKKGYGFIEYDNGKDIFVHYSEILTNQKFKKVDRGDLVEFDLIDGPKGLQAKKVLVVN